MCHLNPSNRFVETDFGRSRNHYDRIAHYIIGYLAAYPMAEWLLRCELCSTLPLALFFLPVLHYEHCCRL